MHSPQTAAKDEKPDSDESLLSRLFGFIAGSMIPLLPAMLGAGMLKVILSLSAAFSLISETSPSYRILSVAGDAFFYFLPIMLASTVAKRIGSSQMLAMLVAGILLHPGLAELFSDGNSSFFGISVKAADYASSVLPILLIVPIMKYLEIFADRITPNSVKAFIKPLIVLLISAPLALIAIAPLGSYLGDYLAKGIDFLFGHVKWLTTLLLAALMPFIVLTGMHRALTPLAVVSLTAYGFDPMLAIAMFCANLAQGGASLAVALKSRDRNMRQIALGAGLTAVVAGVPEPAFYGVTMKLKKPLAAACIAAGIGGLYAGLTGVAVYTQSQSPSAVTLTAMVGDSGYRTLVNGIITLAIVLTLSFALTLIFDLDRTKQIKKDSAGRAAKARKSAAKEIADGSDAPKAYTSTVLCPIAGKVIPLSEVKDATYASGVLGKGCAIDPHEGHLYSPFSGKVDNLSDTLHAIWLVSDDGVELLIHLGRDTVELGGKYFKAYCKAGDAIKAGDLLLDFDLDDLKKAGYDTVTPVIVTNSDRYESVGTAADGRTGVGDKLLNLIGKSSDTDQKKK